MISVAVENEAESRAVSIHTFGLQTGEPLGGERIAVGNSQHDCYCHDCMHYFMPNELDNVNP